MWWMLAGSLFSCMVVLYLFGRRNERAVRRDWELILSPRGERVYRAIEGRLQGEMELAKVTYDEAFAVRALGSIDEAKQLLDIGFKVIERFAPNMLQLLSTMARFSRMVSAIAPTAPLRPRDFRLAEIVSLAYLNGILHQFLVSTSERFRLRLYIIGRGFALATRFLVRSTERIVKDEPEAEREWRQIDNIRHDFETLTDESLQSLHALLTSLALGRRDDLLEGPR